MNPVGSVAIGLALSVATGPILGDLTFGIALGFLAGLVLDAPGRH